MDYVYKALSKRRSARGLGSNFLPLCEVFKLDNYNFNKVNRRQVEKIFKSAEKSIEYINAVYANDTMDKEEKGVLYSIRRFEYANELNRIKINTHTMYFIMKKLDKSQDLKVKNFIFYSLFKSKNENLINLMKQLDKNNIDINLDELGEINIYSQRYSKVSRF